MALSRVVRNGFTKIQPVAMRSTSVKLRLPRSLSLKEIDDGTVSYF